MNACSISANQRSAFPDQYPVIVHLSMMENREDIEQTKVVNRSLPMHQRFYIRYESNANVCFMATGAAGTANTAYEAHEKGAPITGEMLLQAFLTNAVFGYPGDRSKVGARAVEKALIKVHSENTPGIPQGPRAKLAEEKGAIGETPKGLGEKLVPASPEEFIASRGKSSRPQYLTQYNADDLGKMALFKIEGKDAGYALKPDGDLVNVFNATNERGLGDILVRDAISKGANKLDCYDGHLARTFYPKHGFEIVAKEPWNEAFRPAKWLDTDRTPDIIYMKLKRGEENAYNIGKSEGVDASGRTARNSGADQGNVGIDRESDSGSRGGVDNEQQASTPPRMGVLHPESLKPTTAETGIKSQTKTESLSREGIKQEGTPGKTAGVEGKARAAESWQLTQKDFLESQGKALDDPAARLQHETSVEQALAEGKSVPPEVVKDYPHVAKEYETAFVRTKDNKVNMGEIGEDISKEIGMPAAPIRMQYGHYGYGGIHIDIARKGTRLEDIKAAGYSDSIEFVQDIASHYNEIWGQENRKLLLVKRNGDAKVSIVQLMPSERGHYYGVTSAYIAKAAYPASEERKLLWKRQNE